MWAQPVGGLQALINLGGGLPVAICVSSGPRGVWTSQNMLHMGIYYWTVGACLLSRGAPAVLMITCGVARTIPSSVEAQCLGTPYTIPQRHPRHGRAYV